MANEKLEKETLSRFADAKKTRSAKEPDLREAYFFAAPHRVQPGSRFANDTNDTTDTDLQTAIGMEVAGDFATTLMDAYVPQTEPWAALGAGPDLQDGQQEQVKAKCDVVTKKIFLAIAASNFYTEFAKSAFPDGAIGTMAMQIYDKGLGSGPIRCLASPLRELYVTLGPEGEIDDRFIEKRTRYRNLRALLDKEVFDKLPSDITDKIEKKPNEAIDVVWGFWRDWSEAVETWQHTITVNKKLVHEATMRGEGCCQLVVGRFNATSDSPWGYGPLIMALPDLRLADEMTGLKVEGIDFNTRPPGTFPADSMTNLEDGVEAGKFYPIRPGEEGAVKELFKPHPIDAVMYEVSATEDRVRRLHFSDEPTQKGKTPPSATQWADQLQKLQRRIGTPGLSFWAEFCCGVFKRFKYLLEQRGTIEPVKVNGRAIAVYPINPSQRAANMVNVQNAGRLIEIGAPSFPEEWKVTVDGTQTLKNLKDALGDELIAFRKQEDIQQAAQLIGQLQGGQAPGLGGASGAAGLEGGMPPA